MRSNRAAVGWAKKAAAAAPSGMVGYGNGASSGAGRGQRIIVYVIGGITHRCICNALILLQFYVRSLLAHSQQEGCVT